MDLLLLTTLLALKSSDTVTETLTVPCFLGSRMSAGEHSSSCDGRKKMINHLFAAVFGLQVFPYCMSSPFFRFRPPNKRHDRSLFHRLGYFCAQGSNHFKRGVTGRQAGFLIFFLREWSFSISFFQAYFGVRSDSWHVARYVCLFSFPDPSTKFSITRWEESARSFFDFFSFLTMATRERSTALR